VVEGVGGLLVPLDREYTVRELAATLGLPLLIAARPSLGTINHTLLTLQAARAAGLTVVAVVLTPWPARPSRLERSNRESIARLGGVEVEALGRVGGAGRRELARAGTMLPWRRWLAQPSAVEPARAASTTAAVSAVRSCSSMTYGGIV
jgi:dethiobiotin synthetase